MPGGASNRRRGHDAERAVVRYAREHGCPDAVTTRNTGGAGGRQIGDVVLAPGVVVEVKNTKASAWPGWCRQAHAGAGGRIWAVVRKTAGVGDPGEWETMTPAKCLPSSPRVRYVLTPGMPEMVRIPFRVFVDAVRVDR
jgi:hypothetical protein